jgi:Lamin Tail Domain
VGGGTAFARREVVFERHCAVSKALKIPLLPLFVAALCIRANAQVIVNEIHYNPVERPAFDASGNPVFEGTATPADFTDDVHEFVELHNPTAAAVGLAGWRLEGGIDYTFPGGASIAANGYVVVAKNPARIQAVYSIAGVLGPYSGKLGNGGDTVRLVTPANAVSDAVTYGTNFPWAISANRLGASDDFTLLNSATYQYKGRSLQRVSVSAGSNDPANWVAVRPSPFADLPTPGGANIVTRAVPKPVVTALSATQLSDGAVIIRSTAQVKILATFSSNASLSNVQCEYFVDNVNAFGEAPTAVAMTALGNNQFSATLPTQVNRSIVRYRITADRGDGAEVVSPRADDPAVVPTAVATRQPWHAYFVTPIRAATPKPIYDCFVSTDGQALSDTVGQNNFAPFTGLNGLQIMAYNATGNLRRITNINVITTAYPRELGWPGVLSTDRIWNGTVPGVFIENGNVRDVHIRFHGSRYNRRPGRKSYKLLFQDSQHYLDADSVFITDKGDAFTTAHGLHRIAGLPLSHVRYVDWYFNADSVQTRLEQGEYNGDLLDLYHEKMQRLNPGSPKEETGEFYKSVGVILSGGNATIPGGTPSGGEGPYGQANGWPSPATGGSPSWTEFQRFDYSYTLQNHTWKGADPIRDMTNAMWTARGDTYTSPNPNINNLRNFFAANWDVDTELTSLALGNWMGPWDDTTQNYFLWRRASGKYVRLLWDFDSMYGPGVGNNTSVSIYLGEVGDSGNNFRGPNYYKDSFIKAYRTEFKARMWFLNNTLLDPENLQTLTYGTTSGGTNTYFNYIQSQSGGYAILHFNSVNSQVAQGVFYKPTRPTNIAPPNAAAVLPGVNLVGSAYGYNAAYTHAAAPTTSPHAESKWEIRRSTGTYDDPAFIATSTSNLTSLPIPFGELTFGLTYFWRVTYYDADGHPSITSAETSFSYGPTSTSAGNVTINEIMAENLGAVLNGADRPDYVELKNNTGTAIDISGWNLTDDELVPTRYTFPAGTSIAAGDYLVVWCDSAVASPGLHTGFGLSRKGQRVILIQSGIVKDAIAFGPQMGNAALGRISDGVGGWTLVNASPGATNTARAFSTDPSTLKFNEWMAVPASGDDWFEIYNSGAQPVALAGLWLSDTPATPKITQIPSLSFVAAGGCVKFDADGTTSGFSSVNFKLATGGDNLLLSTSNGNTLIQSVSFGTQQPGVSQGYFPDGSAAVTDFPLSSSPNDNNWLPASVRVNEALTNSVTPLEDYVEIYNPTAGTVDISGWWLSDDHFMRQKYLIPDQTTIAPGGYLVIYESAFNIGANAFSLNSLGDEVVLTATSGGVVTGYRALQNFGAAADDVSFGYVPTAGAPEFWPQVTRTPGSANSEPLIGPVIINEIHYHPPDLSGADNARDEFVELHNITTSPVDLTGWKLKGGSEFAFAAGTTLRPGDYILVVGFNPVTDNASLTAFQAALGVPEGVLIYGPFTPKLANDTTSVEIGRPLAPVGGVTPYTNVDKARYFDFAPWPVAADGTGSSLQRISRSIIGNDAANYNGAAPTPGAVNFGQAAIVDNDADGMVNTWEDAFGLDKFSAADAYLDADSDSWINLYEYLAGTNPRSGLDFFSCAVTKAPSGPGFVINFLARAGKSYVIEYKNALSDPTWQTLVTIPAPGSDTAISHTDPTVLEQRFYRVRMPGP